MIGGAVGRQEREISPGNAALAANEWSAPGDSIIARRVYLGGVVVLLSVFAPCFWTKEGCLVYYDSCFTLLLSVMKRIAEAGLTLPYHAFEQGSSALVAAHADFSLEAPVVVLLLATIPASALALTLQPAKASRAAFAAAVAGAAAATALLLRGAPGHVYFRERDAFALWRWATTALPLALGAAASFGIWQRRRWTTSVSLTLAVVALLAMALAPSSTTDLHVGAETLPCARVLLALLAFALVVELFDVRPLLEQPGESEAPSAMASAR